MPDPHVVMYWPDASKLDVKIVLHVPHKQDAFKLLAFVQRNLPGARPASSTVRKVDDAPF